MEDEHDEAARLHDAGAGISRRPCAHDDRREDSTCAIVARRRQD
jgi:hypothetical protein